MRCQAARRVAVLLVRPFASRLLRPLLTSRSGSPPSPFQAQGEISPGKNAILPRTAAGFTPPDPWPRELRGHLPARPARQRLISGSCPSARGFAPRFLPTLGHPHAVALRFARCGQLAGGLTPPRSRPCWAHKKKPAGFAGGLSRKCALRRVSPISPCRGAACPRGIGASPGCCSPAPLSPHGFGRRSRRSPDLRQATDPMITTARIPEVKHCLRFIHTATAFVAPPSATSPMYPYSLRVWEYSCNHPAPRPQSEGCRPA